MKTLLLSSITASLLALASSASAQEQPQSQVIIEQVPAEQPAQPSQPAPPAYETATKPQEHKKKNIPVGLRADGGYSFRTLEKIPVTGADIGLAIGAQPTQHFAVYGAARVFIGGTEAGLGVKALRVTCDFDIVIDRFRIGFDPGIFVVGVDRATKDQSIVAWGPKLGVAARFDVIRADVFALFLRAAADGGPTFSDGSLFGGVTFGAGIDFDIKPGDRESL